MNLIKPGTRFVIRLADGGYYVGTIAKGNLRRSNEISEAQQFSTRWFAMQEINRLDDAQSFAHAAIVDWDPSKAP